ncbi:hypothetical protein COLO4_27014 [Corchorus olitorius]|uniref:DUF4283 domain-containing protein n=1 Tax=Corchorus olitorius TaxID=93759 RepID=A0A1R3HTI6_9ROSI|nr:hypothetical protein COLO4_27014 [Corchorus olitorius]
MEAATEIPGAGVAVEVQPLESSFTTVVTAQQSPRVVATTSFKDIVLQEGIFSVSNSVHKCSDPFFIDGSVNAFVDGSINGVDINDELSFSLSSEERNRVRERWASLIVKVYGKKVGYRFLSQKLKDMWEIQKQPLVVDLGHEFFLLKFHFAEDLNFVIKEVVAESKPVDDGYGPWMVVQARKSKKGKGQPKSFNEIGTSQTNKRAVAEVRHRDVRAERQKYDKEKASSGKTNPTLSISMNGPAAQDKSKAVALQPISPKAKWVPKAFEIGQSSNGQFCNLAARSDLPQIEAENFPVSCLAKNREMSLDLPVASAAIDFQFDLQKLKSPMDIMVSKDHLTPVSSLNKLFPIRKSIEKHEGKSSKSESISTQLPQDKNGAPEDKRLSQSPTERAIPGALGLTTKETSHTPKKATLAVGVDEPDFCLPSPTAHVQSDSRERGLTGNSQAGLGGSGAGDFQSSGDTNRDAARHNPLDGSSLGRTTVGDSSLDSNHASEHDVSSSVRVPDERKRVGGGSRLNSSNGRASARLRQVLMDARLRKANAQSRSSS